MRDILLRGLYGLIGLIPPYAACICISDLVRAREPSTFSLRSLFFYCWFFYLLRKYQLSRQAILKHAQCPVTSHVLGTEHFAFAFSFSRMRAIVSPVLSTRNTFAPSARSSIVNFSFPPRLLTFKATSKKFSLIGSFRFAAMANPVEKKVEDLIANNTVQVFSKSYCP